LWEWSDDGLGEPQAWMRPENPGGGAKVRKSAHGTSLIRNRRKHHHFIRNNSSHFVKQRSEKDSRSFWQTNTESRSSPQQQKDRSLTKPTDSAWGKRSDMSPSPMPNPTATNNKLELFLSLLP